MKRFSGGLILFALCAATAWGQTAQPDPHIGYVYPAGGQQASMLEVLVGGQYLRAVEEVHVSGGGVSARVVQHFRQVKFLNKEQRQKLQHQLRKVWENRVSELPPRDRARVEKTRLLLGRMGAGKKKGKDEAPAEDVELPKHPMLRNLEDKSLREIRELVDVLFRSFKRRQPNQQIGEMVLIEMVIEPDAAPGERELRLRSPLGLTNPLRFHVGTLPEVREQEPNDPGKFDPLPKEPPADLPFVLNGQVMPGDVDRFRFRAQGGERLVVAAQARSLVPYLADAVPGWFQATMALYDARGHELAFADDDRFDPDPVLYYEIPKAGVYELEIRDSIYRGREDFVYRVAVGELPYVTSIFPLGGAAGEKAEIELDGWNLPERHLAFHPVATRGVFRTNLRFGDRVTNEVVYAVDSLPDGLEREANDTIADAQGVETPVIVNGRIDRPGDTDVFAVRGAPGSKIVAEVCARRLRSPLDSLVRITDRSGRALAWNDDFMEKDGHLHTGPGLLTHHADSRVMASIPDDGVACVHITDTCRHGGNAYAYRLRLSPPQPDFSLKMNVASVSARSGSFVPLTVYALRQDGFDGPIDLALTEGPDGCALSGARIPAGRNKVCFTLRTPDEAPGEPVPLAFEGRAKIEGQTVRRAVEPAEDTMQAFLWRHLMPAEDTVLAIRNTRFRPRKVAWAEEGPVRLPMDASTRLGLQVPRFNRNQEIDLVLKDPPPGVSLGDCSVSAGGMEVEVKVASGEMPAGFCDNLIIEAFAEVQPRRKDGKDKKAQKVRRVSLGVLPALPFEVVRR